MVVVLTPDITTQLNELVVDGQIQPYVFFAFSEEDYLEFAKWLDGLIKHDQQLMEIIEYYRSIDDLSKPKEPSP
jgi:hypothetical protein